VPVGSTSPARFREMVRGAYSSAADHPKEKALNQFDSGTRVWHVAMGEGTFSPDGKWLAFTEYTAGKREVYITSFPAKTGKWQVSMGGGHYPRWRGNGKELLFLGQDNSTVMSADLELKGSVPRIGTPKALFTVHLATILQNRLGSAWDPFDVTADGKRFLVNSVDQPQAAEPIAVLAALMRPQKHPGRVCHPPLMASRG
jgi:WD40-like Beta Propeller Repeat